jgi:hypothetical protein
MAQSYWISNVGGIECVGGPCTKPYEEDYFITPDDDDLEDRNYSTLAGFEISVAPLAEYQDALGSLWDESVGDHLGAPYSDFFGDYAISSASVPEYEDMVGAAFSGLKGIPLTKAEVKKAMAADLSLASIKGSLPLLKERNPKRFKELMGMSTAKLRAEKTNPKNITKGVSKIGGDVVSTLNTVAKLPNKAIKATLGNIPVVGSAFSAIADLTPDAALGNISSRVLAGERIDKAFLAAGKNQIRAIKEVAPYAQTVASFVPGVGTGVASAIAAGVALSEGRTITEAVLAATKGALPGGPIAGAAFDAATAIASGQTLDKVAINAVKGRLPPAAQEALSVVEQVARGKSLDRIAIGQLKKRLPPQAKAIVGEAVKAARGKPLNVKDIALRVVQSALPPEGKKALDVGAAMATARNIQSANIRKAADKNTITKVAKRGVGLMSQRAMPPRLRAAAKGLPKKELAGFAAGIGALSTRGLTPQGLATMRQRMALAQRKGFDHAARTVVEANKESDPNWVTFISGGKVSRGPWKRTKGKGGKRGLIVRNGRIERGVFAR